MNAMASNGGSWYVVGNADGYTAGGATTYPEAPNEGNLLYVLSSNGIAQDISGGGGVPRLTSNIIPLASLTTDNLGHNAAFVGNITGLSFLNSNLYAVTDTGQVYQILNYSQTGFSPIPTNPNDTTDPKSIQTKTGGPSLQWIGTIASDTGTGNVAFAGLTVGPPDITETDPTTGATVKPYANMLFGISRTGDLYALGLTTNGGVTTVAKQGIFLDSATHVTVPGLTAASGLAFSSLDVDLWHATTDASAGHATYPAYDSSRVQTVPANANNNLVFAFNNGTTTNNGNYDDPGGAYGSLVTQPFSLVGYSAADMPTLYFDYLLDNGATANYDTARVFASDDGVTWHLLGATVDNPNGDLPSTVDGTGTAQWEQFRLAPPAVPEQYNANLDVYTWSLADFVGDGSVRLRFDFTSAGDMHVGDSGNPEETVGAYLARSPASSFMTEPPSPSPMPTTRIPSPSSSTWAWSSICPTWPATPSPTATRSASTTPRVTC